MSRWLSGVLGWGLLGCVPDYEVHHVTLKLVHDDGQTVRRRISDRTAWELDAQDRALATWPYAPDGVDETRSSAFSMAFVPWELGAQEVSTASLVIDGELALLAGGAGGELTVVVDRLRWNNDPRHPFVHEGQITGRIDPWRVDGSFAIGTGDCRDPRLDAEGCGESWDALVDQEQLQLDVRSVSQDDCPAEVTERYVQGEVVDLSFRKLRMGSAKPLSCEDTDLGGDWGPLACGAETKKLKVDGCNWRVSAYAWPVGPSPERVLEVGVTAAILDDSCPAQTCSVVLTAE